MSHKRKPARTAPRRRTNSSGRTLTLVVVAGVILAGGVLLAGRLSGPSGASMATSPGNPAPAAGSAQVPAIAVTPAVYDLGQVSQAKGIVTVELTVANKGAADLVIREMETSCGCTRAALVIDGRAGPWFGMRGHGEWPTGWSANLRPGQQATLRVQYDPDAHGIYRGAIDRTVVIYSNDPRRAETQVRLTGTQVP